MSCKCKEDVCESTVADTEACSDSEGCCNFHQELLELADEAWSELLKEKIKAHIQATSGEHMDKIAKLVSEANCAKWEHLIEGKAKCHDYKSQLMALMTSCCKE